MLKKILLLTAACLTGGMLFAADNAAAALVGHWPLNEGAGKMVKDVSGHNLSGEIANAESVKWVDGRLDGKALALGGSNGKGAFIYIKNIPAGTFQKGFTVSCYFMPDAQVYRRNSIWYLLCSGRGGKGMMLAVHYQRLLLGGDGNRFSHHAASIYAKNPFQGGEWVHFAGTYDGKGVYKVYIDGALAGVSTGEACGELVAGENELCIGSQYGYAPLTGALADVKLFNRPLTAHEIMQESLAEQ